MELGLLLEMVAGDHPDRVAITDNDGTSITCGQLQSAAVRAAHYFLQKGARQVGFLGTNGSAFPVSLFGAALAGTPLVPFNYRLSDDQLSELLSRTTDLFMVAAPEMLQRLTGLGFDSVVTTDQLLAFDGPESPLSAIDPDEVAIFLYTSGTTAAPKAAVLRHRHLMAYVIGSVEFSGADADDAVLVSVPPYHIAGVSSVLTSLFAGRRIVYLDPFDPDRWLQLVVGEGVTNAMVVPTMLARIVDRVPGMVADVPTLRSLAYGGAKMPLPVIERALACFPDVDFTNAYGLTETSSTIAVLGPVDHRAAVHSDQVVLRRRLSSAGRALPGVEIAVFDDDGVPAAAGVVGDVFVRGDQVSGEYFDGSRVDPAGWFPTRDRGWLDEESYLFIEGRSDDTIIRGGENISPAEIEDVLLRHPSVKECAVVGIPDDEWGQRIVAVVVCAPDSVESSEILRTWCQDHLRSSKTPDLITFTDALPYTETGKLLRRVLQAELS